MHIFCKLITYLTLMHFSICLRHLYGVLACFMQNNKMTQALIDCKITVFAQNPHCIITVDVSTLVYIKLFR